MEVGPHGIVSPARKRDVAVLLALPVTDEQRVLDEVEIGQIETDALHETQACPVEQLEDRPIALTDRGRGVRRFEHAPDFGLTDRARKTSPRGQRYGRRRTQEEDLTLDQESQEAPDDRDVMRARVRSERA